MISLLYFTLLYFNNIYNLLALESRKGSKREPYKTDNRPFFISNVNR